jgi:hypothetical protein
VNAAATGTPALGGRETAPVGRRLRCDRVVAAAGTPALGGREPASAGRLVAERLIVVREPAT